MSAFVYIWEDLKTGMKYIGAHKGLPDDGYVSSSIFLNEIYEQRPQDFRRVIIAKCDTFKDAIHQETLLCKAVNAARNPDYYNRHNGDGNFYNKGHSQKTRKKLSQSHKGKVKSKEHCRKISEYQLGRTLSEETKRKMSTAHKGKPKSKKHILNQSKSRSRKWILELPGKPPMIISNLNKYAQDNNLPQLYYYAKKVQ